MPASAEEAPEEAPPAGSKSSPAASSRGRRSDLLGDAPSPPPLAPLRRLGKSGSAVSTKPMYSVNTSGRIHRLHCEEARENPTSRLECLQFHPFEQAGMEYESVLKEIGGFGRVQKAIFLALSFTSFKAVLDLELMVLTLHESKFRCAQQNSSDYVAQNYSEHCRISRLVGDDTNFTLINETCTKFDYQHGDVISKSMVEEYNLVCDRKHYATGMMSVFFLGCALGMLFGTLGDKIGRKKILIVCGVTDLITTILPAFMPTAETQIFARFLKGFPAAVYYQGLLIMEEMTEEKHRAVLGNLYWLFWCATGYMFSGVVVYIFKEWDKIQLFSTVFCLNYIVIFIVVPESPRWLVLKGRVEEAVDVLKRIAKWNGIKWEHKVSKVKALDVEEEPTGNILDLVTYPEMRMKSIVIFFNLAMFAMCYFGLSTDTTFITTNIVLNVLLNGAVEIPSSFIGWLGSDRYGRKYTTVIITVLSGFCLIAVPIVPTGGVYNIVKAVVAMANAFLQLAIASPTYGPPKYFQHRVRNNGLFLATTLAMLSNIVAPVINTLSDVATFLPGLIFGITSIVSALSLLLLPETKGLPLPETVPSSEGLVRGRERQWAIETFSRERAQSLLDDDDMEAVN
uniref:MFS domain-containing protein n=1 Tax=Macrostomum lignano TaxID=282301 RepID=A0A1I8IFA2_9PLAT